MSLSVTVLGWIGFKVLGAMWRVTVGQLIRWRRNRTRRSVYVSNFVASIDRNLTPPSLSLNFTVWNEGNSPISPVAIRLSAYIKEALSLQIIGELDHLPQVDAPKSIKAHTDVRITITYLIDWRVWACKYPNVTLSQSALIVKTSSGPVEIPLQGSAAIDYGACWDDPSSLDTRITRDYTSALEIQIANLSERLGVVEIDLQKVRGNALIGKTDQFQRLLMEWEENRGNQYYDRPSAPNHAPTAPSKEAPRGNTQGT